MLCFIKYKLFSPLVQTLLLELMGNQQTAKDNITKEDWEIIKIGLNQNEIWRNRKDHQLYIEEYHLESYQRQKLDAIRDLYFIRKNHSRWVSAYFFIEDQSDQYCASRFSVKLYLERIQRRLTELHNVPFSDSLHLFDQALHGYWEFARRFGCFEVQRQYMGINDRGILKTWAGPDWKQMSVIGGKISQQKMVKSIIQSVQASIEQSTLPAAYPTFKNYLYRANSSVNFQQAVEQLYNYAKITNGGVISSSLNFKLFQPYQTVQNYTTTPPLNGRQFLSSKISTPSYRVASSIQTTINQRPQLSSSNVFSVPIQQKKVNVGRTQNYKNQAPIRMTPIPHITISNKVSQFKQSPGIQRQSIHIPAKQDRVNRLIQFSTNQRQWPMNGPLQVPPSSSISQRSPRFQNQIATHSILVPQAPPSGSIVAFRASKQHLASNKSIKGNFSESKSIIMQLYLSHDNMKLNPNDIPEEETKSFGNIKKSQSIKDETEKQLNPIFEGDIPQIQQSPHKQKEPIYIAQSLKDDNKLIFSNKPKITYEFNKDKSNYASISHDDGKSSEDFLKKIRDFGTYSTVYNKFQTNDHRFNSSQFNGNISTEFGKHNQSRTGSSFSPPTLTPQKSDFQHPIESKQSQPPPYSTYKYDLEFPGLQQYKK